MMPRWVKVEQLRVGDIFIRQDRNVGLVESVQQNPRDQNRLWLKVNILSDENRFTEGREMNLCKTQKVILVNST